MFSICLIIDCKILNQEVAEILLEYIDYVYQCVDYISIALEEVSYIDLETKKQLIKNQVHFIDNEYFDKKNYNNLAYFSNILKERNVKL